MTLDDLVGAGFPAENFPEDLPEPGEANITMTNLDGSNELYRYEANIDGKLYAMEVVLDRENVPDPAEGVSFMLNQFAYLWRTNKDAIAAESGRRINF